jgi:hypothetical protein
VLVVNGGVLYSGVKVLEGEKVFGVVILDVTNVGRRHEAGVRKMLVHSGGL